MSRQFDSGVAMRPLDAVRAVRRIPWSVGEFVHRRLARTSTDADTATGRDRAGRPSVPSPADPSEVPRPFRPRPTASVDNPTLTAHDVTDYGRVDFVADPFLVVTDAGDWHLFFEVFNAGRDPPAVVGHATSDDGGRSWEYDRVVLREDDHLAFPYAFEHGGEFYMLPERWNRESPAPVRLYRAAAFPGDWRPVSTVVRPDRQLVDCVAFEWNDRWWALAGTMDDRHELRIYYADELLADGWTPHEANPVVSGRPRAARPAGRPIVGENGVLFFFQDVATQYGDKVRAFDVEELTPTSYADSERPESPILEGTDSRLGWNSGRMHHVDPLYTDDGWVCAVDGNVAFGERLFSHYHWSIGTYRG